MVTQNESLTPGPGSCVILQNLLFEFGGQIASTDERAVHGLSTRACVVLCCTTFCCRRLVAGSCANPVGRLCGKIHQRNSCEEEELDWARLWAVPKMLVTCRRRYVRTFRKIVFLKTENVTVTNMPQPP